jgi:cellulose synthase/poly-beta-1,6-N-acetylglucosamine synthase-like glycosyltransferase
MLSRGTWPRKSWPDEGIGGRRAERMLVLKYFYAFFDEFILFYVIVVNGFYLTLFFLSLAEIRKYMRSHLFREDVELVSSELTPPVTIIVPAYNEAVTIRESVLSLTQLHYPEYEIIIVNDGSTDETLEVLKREFHLVRVNQIIRQQIRTKPIRQMYRSRIFSNILVVDKENGGKADALNAGINVCTYPYFCGVDADSLLEKDSLLNAMRPFIEGENELVACGGIVRIANGCTVRNGKVVDVGLPRNLIAAHQVIEYLRSFLMGRIGMSRMNSLLIISGAFGIFRKRDIIAIGGYNTETIGEDMELVVRLQKHLYESKQEAKVLFVPDPVCWTEAPQTLRVLQRQRMRWATGLIESLALHKSTIFNPKYGAMGLLSMPYFLLVETLGPVIELFGTVFFLTGLFLGFVNVQFAVFFAFATLVFGVFLSLTAVLLEEISFRRYTKVKDFVKLVLLSFLENFWYRQVNAFWKTWSVIRYVRRRKMSWGHMERKGLTRQT